MQRHPNCPPLHNFTHSARAYVEGRGNEVVSRPSRQETEEDGKALFRWDGPTEVGATRGEAISHAASTREREVLSEAIENLGDESQLQSAVKR
jgi:hypothetical protein